VDAAGPSPAKPPPFLRRHLGASTLLLLVLLTLLLRLVWGWQIDRQVNAYFAVLRARGQPATREDLILPPIPATENAWVVYERAFAQLSSKVKSPRADSRYASFHSKYAIWPPHGDAWEADAKASETANAAFFSTVRVARQIAKSQPRTRIADRLMSFYLDLPLTAAEVLADGAEYQHLRGSDGEAIERLLDLLHLARSVRQDPTSDAQYFGQRTEVMAADAVLKIAPALRIGGSAGASANQVRKLIRALLDDAPPDTPSMRRVVQTERARLTDWQLEQASSHWVTRPLAKEEILRAAEAYGVLERMATSSTPRGAHGYDVEQVLQGHPSYTRDFTDGIRFLPFNRDGDRLRNRYSRFLWAGYGERLPRLIQCQFLASQGRRCAAVSLAVNLFRIEQGDWPSGLDDLVPTCLDAVPTYSDAVGHPPFEISFLRWPNNVAKVRPVVCTQPDITVLNAETELEDLRFEDVPTCRWSWPSDSFRIFVINPDYLDVSFPTEDGGSARQQPE
jgi:hypothetical protein